MSEFGIEAVGGNRPVPKLSSKKEVEEKLKCLWTICWGEEERIDWTPRGEFEFRERQATDPVFRPEDFERGRDGVGGLDLLGRYRYRRADSLVTIYIDSCQKVTQWYEISPESLIEVVLIHELAHLMTHRGFDRDDLSSSFMEHTAQCATYAYLKPGGGEALKAFELLSPRQPFIYRTWEGLKELPKPRSVITSRPDEVQEVVKAFFLKVRDTLSPPDKSEIGDVIGYDE
jgi:hypothetical protein